MSAPPLPHNVQERVIAIVRRVGELLSGHFTGWPPPPGKYDRAIDANYKDLPLVLTVCLTVEDSGARTVKIFSHEQDDPRTTTVPLFTGHWHAQGEYDIKLWRSGPWEALFLAGDIAGTA